LIEDYELITKIEKLLQPFEKLAKEQKIKLEQH